MAVLNHIHEELLKNIHDQEVLVLSEKLEHIPFEQIRQYYMDSRDFIKVEQTGINAVISYMKYSRKFKINLMYDLKYNCWRCECRNHWRTGMPCAHLFRLIKDNGGLVGYYIN